MKKSFCVILIGLFLVAILAACTWAEVKVKLQFMPNIGDAYQVKMTADQVITETLQGQDLSIAQTFGFGYSIKATKTDENKNVWLDIVYDWVSMNQKSSMGEMTYDSSNPADADSPLAPAFKGLIGRGFSIKSSPAGDVLEVNGVDEMISGMINDLGITDTQTLAQIETTIKDQYNDETLKDQMGNMLIEFPTGAVKIGDTWTSKTTSTGLVPLTVDSTYTLQAYKDGIATIHVVSRLQSDPDAKPTSPSGYDLKYTLSGAQEGVMAVDTQTGWSVNSTITQTISGTATITMEQQDTTLPMSIFSVVHLEMGKKQ